MAWKQNQEAAGVFAIPQLPEVAGAAVTLEGLGVERKATAPQNKGSGGRTELAKGMGGQC